VDEPRRLVAERPALRFSTPLTMSFLSRVAPDGAILEAELLIALRDTYRTVLECHEASDELSRYYPRLFGVVQGLPYHAPFHHELEKVFTPRGEIADDASDELGTLRKQQRTLQRRIEHSLDRLLRDPDRNRYLAEDYYTQLNERYVVLVKADNKGRIPGIVQGESASGLSLYVEPLEIVESNNSAIEAKVEEQREIRRILRRLSDRAHAFRDEYPTLLEGLAWLDSTRARALYAQVTRASVPVFVDDLTLRVVQARHPLLGERCVPIDLALSEGDRILVLSGVNSGGKTVALKTVGLLSLMAQSGMHVSAGHDTKLPLCDRVACEIGDQQSIAQNLSSFSSHVTHVSRILGNLGTRTLLLFDEFMTGTDPEEGAALAEAVLADLARREVLALATTHYGPLKLLPKKYPGFVNVAVEFDWERLSPTFRLLCGVPGSSLGLDIASRFGMPQPVVEAARGFVDSGKSALSDMIRDLEEQLVRATAERKELAELVLLTERERTSNKNRWEALEKARLAELDALKAREIEEMESFKTTVHQALRHGPAPDLPGRIQEKIRLKEKELDSSRPPPPEGLKPGDWVRISNMRESGLVMEIRKDRQTAMVLVNGIQIKTALSSLVVTQPPPKPVKQKTVAGTSARLVAKDLPLELNLISLRVEEALEQLSEYMDAAYARSYREVRIVHGKGTGALRSAVDRFLKTCPMVKSHRLGAFGEGEGGVTIVTFR